jgi:uncharacterized protein YdaU (DUF1376 family)
MALPYFPMFPTDFEAKTSHLTLAEDGAYNRLLRLMWMTPGCTLPADDAWVMRRMRVDQVTFDAVVKVVIDEFFTVEKGRLSNAKLGRIFVETNTAHEKRVSAGSKGGKAKSLKSNNSNSSNAKAMPKQPEPEPEPIREDTKVSSTQEAARFYERYLKAHPKPIPSDAGEVAFSALVEAGESPAIIVASAAAYAEKVRSWSGDAKVQQSDNFLDADRGQWRLNVPAPIAVPATKQERMEFWANAINSDKFVSPTSIKPDFARELIAAEMVTAAKLKARGIAA